MISVLIVGGSRLQHELLADVLGRTANVDVLGGVRDVGKLAGLLEASRPDVVLVDASDRGALGLIGLIRRTSREVKILALAVSENEDEILELFEAGVAGYVTYGEGSLEALVETLETIARGEAFCTPRVAALLLDRVAALAAVRKAQPGLARLTARELEIAALLRDGLSNKEIAGRLHIGLPTVKNHVHNILEKLQVRRRSEAAARLAPAQLHPAASLRHQARRTRSRTGSVGLTGSAN